LITGQIQSQFEFCRLSQVAAFAVPLPDFR
jgi:hypothetical protein